MRIAKKLAGKSKVKENIFALVIKKDEYLDTIKEYTRTKDKKVLQYLQDVGAVARTYEHSNLIVDVGLTFPYRVLSGDPDLQALTPANFQINYGGYGEGTPDEDASRTELVDEVFRKVKASSSFTNKEMIVDFFLTAQDYDGTITEFANFINGTDTPDSGVMWTYVDTGGWVKSNLESLFISCQYSIEYDAT